MAPRNPSRTMPSDRAPDRVPVKQRPDEQRIDGVQMSSIPLRRRQRMEAGHDPRDPNRPDQEARRAPGN